MRRHVPLSCSLPADPLDPRSLTSHRDAYALVDMSADPVSHIDPPTCYFTLPLTTSHCHSHFSTETPTISPFSTYSPYTCSEPENPLLAVRPDVFLLMSSSSDAARFLQLQTAAAHRPAAEPLQHRDSSTSSSSSSSSSMSSQSNTGLSPHSISCCRCRRDCLAGMYQIGTNRYYCSHCARMTGYSAG